MELTPELLGTATVGAIVIIGAIGRYLQAIREKPPTSATTALQAIGASWGDKEQTERLIDAVGRCADALEVLADKRADDMHKELLAHIDMKERREEQEEQTPRRPTTRRR
jgi:hypothetical protein